MGKKRIIRVFPRRTKATPDDDLARVGMPTMFDVADEVHVSVTFTDDRPEAEFLAEQWKYVSSNIRIGGPAYDDPGGEFIPGMYLKNGYTITSRGCPNKCWFCMVPHREGQVREYAIKEGNNVLDSNLLACSDDHIRRVFEMLRTQRFGRVRFTGGFEAARMRPWIIEELKTIRVHTCYFAYDTPDDYDPLVETARMFKDGGVDLFTKNKKYFAYVLIGYPGDSIEVAEKRMVDVMLLGFPPMAMLYNRGVHFDQNYRKRWISFQRQWANKFIVGAVMNEFMGEEMMKIYRDEIELI